MLQSLPRLRRFNLNRNERTSDWDLNDEKGETLRSFSTKAQAFVTGMLERTVKPGTVLVYYDDGTHDELTYR
jgi:hypothetical protein